MSVRELTLKMLESLEKKEAPIVARTRRKYLKQAGFAAAKRKWQSQKDTEKAEEDTKDLEKSEPLAKNDYQVTSYDNGDLKMEFGPEVPEDVKKLAMDWAKRRGLRVKEASLGKSLEGFEWLLMGK